MAMGWYERIISMDGKLQGKARSNRRLLFLLSCAFCATHGVMAFLTEVYPQAVVTMCLHLANQLVMLLLCVCGVHLTDSIVRAYVVVLALVIISSDLTFRTLGSPPMWPAFVLLADLSLVIGLGSRFATWLTGAAALWVIITVFELVLRFGLLDLPGTAPDSFRWERIRPTVECTNPPCPISAVKGMYEAQMSLIVLLVDFGATRGFAESAEREKAAMARTIETVEAIAQLLAGYDVDTVAEMLEAEAEGRLPAAMYEALSGLEQNLRAYRPYLPKSCLPTQQGDDSAESILLESMRTGSPRNSVVGSTPRNRSASIDSDGRRPLATKVLGVLKTARSTLLAVNTCNALACLEQDPRTFTSFFEMLLTNTMMAVESRRGLVDVFVGDRILASFNTSRPCLVHAAAAAGAAQQIVQAVRSFNTQQDNSTDSDLRVSIGAASGHVPCGDTGCTEMRRFNLLGVLPVLTCGMERVACALGLDVVCNTKLQRESEHEYALLLVPRRVRLVKQSARGGNHVLMSVQLDNDEDSCFCVYSLLVEDEGNVQHDRDGEWMYHVGKAAAEWNPYNAAIRAYLSGTDVQKAAEMAGEHRRQAHSTISLLGHTTPLDVHV